MGESKPANFRSLSSKFSRFIVLLFVWMVMLIILWDVRRHTFDTLQAVLMVCVLVFIAGLISRFTMRALGVLFRFCSKVSRPSAKENSNPSRSAPPTMKSNIWVKVSTR